MLGYGGGAKTTAVYNNTIANNAGGAIDIISDSPNSILTNNIMFGNAAGVTNYGATGTVLSHNLTSDPKFVNPGAFDFSLQAGSPAIDAGGTIPQVPVDINGVARPQGSAFDIGAYEFKGQ